MMTTSIHAALQHATAQLRASGANQSDAGLDARVLVCAVLGRPRTHLIAHAEQPLTDDQLARLSASLQRRLRGEPIAYILGRREFWSLDLEVSSATLIPRPDTETLVQATLDELAGVSAPRILDLGTGSGAVALALASERSDAQVVATDRDPQTLAVARRNGERLAPGRVEWRQGSWFDAVDKAARFDAVVSNPPYIAPDDPHLAQGDVRFEPVAALCAAQEGMADLAHLIATAPDHLSPGGRLLVEHGFTQAPAVGQRFERAGYEAIRLVRDLAGQPRVTLGRRL